MNNLKKLQKEIDRIVMNNPGRESGYPLDGVYEDIIKTGEFDGFNGNIARVVIAESIEKNCPNIRDDEKPRLEKFKEKSLFGRESGLYVSVGEFLGEWDLNRIVMDRVEKHINRDIESRLSRLDAVGPASLEEVYFDNLRELKGIYSMVNPLIICEMLINGIEGRRGIISSDDERRLMDLESKLRERTHEFRLEINSYSYNLSNGKQIV